MIHDIGQRAVAAFAAAFCLLLTGCFVSPGKFDSELVLKKDNSFSFRYDGEILFLGLTQLAKMGAESETAFTPECFDEETFDTRDCTDEEKAAQREEWEAGRAARVESERKKAEQLSKIMGGIDPNDPKAAEELSKLLLRHKGWESVVHKGDGVFEVRFAISGDATHDFAFPTLERIAVFEPFVQFIQRKDRQIRVEAPRFAVNNESEPFGGMTGGMAGLAAMGSVLGSTGPSGGEDGSANEPNPATTRLDGTFSIVTDGEILANNTDEGPTADPLGRRLTWIISPSTDTAPTALIALGS